MNLIYLTSGNMKIIRFILLLFLLGISLFIRIQGNSFGLPYIYHSDEPATIKVAVKFGLGDLNPHYFGHPTLLHYLLFFTYVLYFFIGKFFGFFNSITDFETLFFINPTSFYLIGRTIAALFGAMTILLVYILSKRVFNKNIGLLSALFLTFTFLHTRTSHYARHDIPVTFFIVLTYIFIIDIYKKSRIKDYVLSGFFSGLAIATNWNAVVLIPSIIISHILACRKRDKNIINSLFNKLLILSGLMILVGLFCGAPFIFLDFKTFYQAFFFQVGRFLSVHPVEPVLFAQRGWVFYVSHSLFYGLGWPLLILSIAGLLYAIYKHSREDILIIAFPVFYYLFFGYMGSSAIDEYIIPILPFLVLLAARVFLDAVYKLKIESFHLKIAIIAILSFSVIWIPAKYTMRHNWLLAQSDTRTLAKRWIENNIPKGSKIALEKYVYVGPQNIPLVEIKEEKIARLNAILEGDQLKGKVTKHLLKLPYPGNTYRLIEIAPSFHMLEDYENYYDYEQLKTDKVEYVVVRNFFPDMFFSVDIPKQRDFFEEIESRGELIKEFNPFKENTQSKSGGGRISIHTPFDDVFNRILPGPRIKIYKLR